MGVTSPNNWYASFSWLSACERWLTHSRRGLTRHEFWWLLARMLEAKWLEDAPREVP